MSVWAAKSMEPVPSPFLTLTRQLHATLLAVHHATSQVAPSAWLLSRPDPPTGMQGVQVQQGNGPLLPEVRTYLIGYLNSMKYIIVCMVYTLHGIYHLQVYTIGRSHLHPGTYHLIPCYVPEKTIHTMAYTIQIGIYREARIGQTCIYHGIYHPDYCIYHGIYQKTGIYHGIYHEATQSLRRSPLERRN